MAAALATAQPAPAIHPPVTQASGTSRPSYESARAQVQGVMTFADDMVHGTLFAAPILSTVAHGRLLAVHMYVAMDPAGAGHVLSNDILGDPDSQRLCP
jgi:xanthine dehydrogenase large subunit